VDFGDQRDVYNGTALATCSSQISRESFEAVKESIEVTVK